MKTNKNKIFCKNLQDQPKKKIIAYDLASLFIKKVYKF